MNETIRALGVFLLSCTLAAGSLLALCLLADRHYKARLAKEYTGIEASMRPEQVKARAEHHRWQHRYTPTPCEDYPYYAAETRWEAEVRNKPQ